VPSAFANPFSTGPSPGNCELASSIMATFDSTKTALSKLLEQVVEGKIQLPDFQRGWIWDDTHIRELLLSIARSFPIGAIMLLETGGDVRFQIKLVEGVKSRDGATNSAELLILDGQQRLTSLTQVLKLPGAVKTRDDKGREVARFYYFDIEAALTGNNLENALVAVDGNKTSRTNFGRDIVLDLSTQEKEFAAFHFPCNQILNSDQWEEGLLAYDQAKLIRFIEFRKRVLNPFREYYLPVIELNKETSREAVCLVFEKVNTGGVPLSVFELVTATYAADGFNLRDDWFGRPTAPGRHKRFESKPLLRDLEPTEFLQGISLLHTYKRRQDDLSIGRTGKEATAVSAKREHVLGIPLESYRQLAEPLTKGFFAADRFLRMEGFHHPKFLPYRSQVIALATAMVHLDERWLEPIIYGKLARWYWCGVLGELYGGAIETRIALDLQHILAWVNDPGATEPATITAAGFQPSRLDTLRTRTSAAYRGIYILLQREGSKDFFWKARMVDLDRDECEIDIHHIFPRAWCETQKIEPRIFNAIVNKTPISYKANRMIGGKAPSEYLEQIRNHPQAQMSIAEQDGILRTHLVDPLYLRENNFHGFYAARKEALLKIIDVTMDKRILPSTTEVSAKVPEDEDDDEQQS
jgi:hypothetical protein